jgi:hypothetical protein
MSDPSQADGDDGFADLPLRERLPEYLAVFALGLAASVVLGLLISLTPASVGDAVGYTVLLIGAGVMFMGGASGGGYANVAMGLAGKAVGGGRGAGEESARGRPRMDPHERLRRGLRPEANPRALWQVIGGAGYVVVGFVVLYLFGS